MDIFKNFKNVILKNYANFDGRASRSEYWWFTFVNCLVALLLNLISVPFIANENYGATMALSAIAGIYSLAIICPGLAVAIRRLHDIGKSGFYYFMGFIPLAGPIILLVYLVTASEPNANTYGPVPGKWASENPVKPSPAGAYGATAGSPYGASAAGGYGTPSSAPGASYGSGAYGTPASGSAYGASASGASYGASASGASYGASASGASYGASASGSAYGSSSGASPSSGYGFSAAGSLDASSGPSSYGAGAYSTPSAGAASSYGAGGYGASASGGYGASAYGTSYGTPEVSPYSAPEVKPYSTSSSWGPELVPEDALEADDDEKTMAMNDIGMMGFGEDDKTVSLFGTTPQPRAYLIRKNDGSRFDVKGMTFTLGKSAANATYAVSDSQKMSRMHATMMVENGEFFVRDDSKNGTWVNDFHLDKGTFAPIKDGDTLRLADVEFTFHTFK